MVLSGALRNIDVFFAVTASADDPFTPPFRDSIRMTPDSRCIQVIVIVSRRKIETTEVEIAAFMGKRFNAEAKALPHGGLNGTAL